MELTQAEHQLIETAKKIISEYFSPKHHRLVTCILTHDGRMITGINVEGPFGCNDVCAEQIALGNALSQGIKDIACIVTVKHPRIDDTNQSLRVVSPCGKCREIILDYAPNAHIIVMHHGKMEKVPAHELLPYRYVK